MKQLHLLFLAVLFIGIFTSCNKSFHDATLVRDCTGTYARMNQSDYLIANPSSVEAYSDKENIRIQFENTQNEDLDGILGVCLMYHEYKGVIRIKHVK